MPAYKDYFTQVTWGSASENVLVLTSLRQGLITHNSPSLCSTLPAFIQGKPGLWAQEGSSAEHPCPVCWPGCCLSPLLQKELSPSLTGP